VELQPILYAWLQLNAVISNNYSKQKIKTIYL